MKLKKIALAITMCMVIGLQVIIPVGAMEARYAVCPHCGGNVNVYNTTETLCEVQTCAVHSNCHIHTTYDVTYRVKNCSGCDASDSKDELTRTMVSSIHIFNAR